MLLVLPARLSIVMLLLFVTRVMTNRRSYFLRAKLLLGSIWKDNKWILLNLIVTFNLFLDSAEAI